MSWSIWAAIGAAASNHIGTQMTARNQRNAAYAGDVNIADVQRENIISNLNNSPAYEAQARNVNWSSQQANLANLELLSPGYGRWTQAQSSQALGMSRGMLGASEADSIVRNSYENQYSSGVRGQAREYGVARDFGRTQFANSISSQQIIQQLAELNKVNLSGIGDYYTTTAQAINNALTNRAYRQDWLNAEQAAKNTRKNAPWAFLSGTALEYTKMKSGKTPGADMTAYRSNDTAFMNG